MAEPYEMELVEAGMSLSKDHVKKLAQMFRSPEWQEWQKIVDGIKQTGAAGVLLNPKLTETSLMFRQQGAWLFERCLDDTSFSIVTEALELQKSEDAKKKS